LFSSHPKGRGIESNPIHKSTDTETAVKTVPPTITTTGGDNYLQAFHYYGMQHPLVELPTILMEGNNNVSMERQIC